MYVHRSIRSRSTRVPFQNHPPIFFVFFFLTHTSSPPILLLVARPLRLQVSAQHQQALLLIPIREITLRTIRRLSEYSPEIT
jgi:hypothetical protein